MSIFIRKKLYELVEAHLLEKNKNKNHTRYTLTKDGKGMINYFVSHISEKIKNEIDIYVQQNKKRIHTESEVIAKYYAQSNNDYDYIVKCSLNDSDGTNIMEINVPVATQQQAQIICNNWKDNAGRLYGTILNILIGDEK